MNSKKPKRGDYCRSACPTQDHASYTECKLAASFDAGWCSALMQLDIWIRQSIEPKNTQVKQIRHELISMFNDAHLEHMPVTKEAMKKLGVIK